jgi:hypothetical protein
MVWMGVYSQTFLPAISASNTRILEQSKKNVEYRVHLDTKETAHAR